MIDTFKHQYTWELDDVGRKENRTVSKQEGKKRGIEIVRPCLLAKNRDGVLLT